MRWLEDWVVVFTKDGSEHQSPRCTKGVALEYLELIPDAIAIQKVRGIWKRRISRKSSSFLAPPTTKEV